MRGVSAKRLRSSDLESPFHGVRSARSDSDSEPARVDPVRTLCTAYATRMPTHRGFSHLTAVRLFGLPVPERLRDDQRLHVSAIAPHRAPRGAGVRGYQLSIEHAQAPGTLQMLDGLRVISAVDTWCQMGAHLTVDELVVVGDGILRRQRPLATLGELRNAAERYAGARGARALSEALPLIRAGTDSPKETELRLAIIRSGLPEPEVNITVYDSYGLPIARGDLVYPRYKVLVEYDGAHHREIEQQYFNDVDRDDRVIEAGWRIIHFNRSHRAARQQSALESVRRALVARGWIPPA
ncbi:hypothetical protein EV379_3399 [Microterricola gilva]|uniref:DUF559 domain-containing protein n=1 Tax=Microterricola gilva TaxID=393267 RepID=A0A4Q8AQP6_9MICO|nr:hypothetical protein EV379_3399 [Microterricola gilva]